MNERMKKAEYLFDEIGLIDDAIVSHAAEYGIKKKSTSFAVRKAVLLAAAVAVTVSLMSTLLYVGFFRDDKEDSGTDDTADGAVVVTDSLAGVLTRAQSSDIVKSVSDVREIAFFDGNAKIIWQRDGEENFYFISVKSYADKTKLETAMNLNYAQSKPLADGDKTDVLVWIAMDDGTVVSPELRRSSGNVSYAELFDYSAEISASDELAELIDDLCS